MEVRNYTYEEMPEYSGAPDGSVRIPTSGNEVGIAYFNDVPYCTAGGTKLNLQVLVPYTRNEGHPFFCRGSRTPKHPCIVYVQGSAWMKQHCHAVVADAARLARRGYVIAVVEYRSSDIAPFPAQIIDALNAVRFMKVHADEYRADPERMILAGNSSGGHTAVYGGIYHNDADPEENLFPGVSADVRGIINQYGSTDFTFPDSNPTTPNHNAPDSPEGRVMGGRDLNAEPELARKLTVRCNITPETQIVPTLILHGTKDRTVNCMCSVLLYEHLKACGKDTQLLLIEGADHGGPEFFSDAVLDAEEAFIRRCCS